MYLTMQYLSVMDVTDFRQFYYIHLLIEIHGNLGVLVIQRMVFRPLSDTFAGLPCDLGDYLDLCWLLL